MSDLKIYLARYNTTGAIAAIENEDDDSDVTVHIARYNPDPRAACIHAATRLRELADAFDRLSVMEDPFKESTQIAAMVLAAQEAV